LPDFLHIINMVGSIPVGSQFGAYSHWENASDLRSVIRLGRVMLDLWLASYPAPDANLNRIWLSSGLSEAQESPGRQ
jgi:hypothetical protein